MLRKWFEHSAGVDLARIAEFIDAYDTFQRDDGDSSTRHINWQLAYLDKFTADRGSCGCPPEPEGPIVLTGSRKEYID